MNTKHQIIGDEDFWTRLEYDASYSLQSATDPTLRKFWIDGFVPEKITNSQRGADVDGIAWVGEGGRIQHQYRFVVSVPQRMLAHTTKNFSIETFVFAEEQKELQIAIQRESCDKSTS